MSYRSDLLHLFSVVSIKRRIQLCAFCLISLAVVIAEMVTLGALVPFIALLLDPAKINKFPFLISIIEKASVRYQLEITLAICFGFLIVFSGLIRIAATWFGLRFAYGLGADLSSLVYSRSLYRPYQWFISNSSSQIMAGVEIAGGLTFRLIAPMIYFFIALLSSIGILLTLFWIDFKTAFICSTSFILSYLLIAAILSKRISSTGKVISDFAAFRYRAIQEGLGGIREIILDGSQSVYSSRFSQVEYTQKRAQASAMLMSSTPRFFIEMIGMLLIVATTLWLSSENQGIAGALPFLSALAFGAQKLMPQVQTIYQSWASFVSCRQALRDTVEFLSHESAPDADTNATPVPEAACQFHKLDSSLRPLIEFKEVGFCYSASPTPVLQAVNLRILPGDRVGFVGETGSGKSTLIDLIMGLLQRSSGLILVDGETLKEANLRKWQRRIAHVPQSIFLTEASVAENIALGVPLHQIDMERVRVAASRAQVDCFVQAMPQKYLTPVGERGIRLSGGQRQRIGLARALYKGADVLVLDEATSALDDETEKSVMSAVNSLGPELTVLMIAHRVSTLSECNVIYRLEHGIAQRVGSYNDLIGSVYL